MSLSDLADLVLRSGLFLLAMDGAIFFVLAWGGQWWSPGMLTDKVLRKALIEDYRSKKVALGGPLGLIKWMAIIAAYLIVAGGLLKLGSSV